MLISKKISRAYDTVKLYLDNGDGTSLSNEYLEGLRENSHGYEVSQEDDRFLRQSYDKEVKLMNIHLEEFKKMQAHGEDTEYIRNLMSLIETRIIWHRKFNLLDEILTYVASLRWIVRSESKEKMRVLMETGYNYEATAKSFNNVSVHSIRSMASYTLGNLEKKIGKDTIDILMQEEVDKAELQFRIGTGSFAINRIFIKGVTRLLPETKMNGNLKLLECLNELKQLKLLTALDIRKKIRSLKIDKLEHILAVVESSDSRYVYERAIIYRYFNDGISFPELEKLLQELEGEDILKKKLMSMHEENKENLE